MYCAAWERKRKDEWENIKASSAALFTQRISRTMGSFLREHAFLMKDTLSSFLSPAFPGELGNPGRRVISEPWEGTLSPYMLGVLCDLCLKSDSSGTHQFRVPTYSLSHMIAYDWRKALLISMLHIKKKICSCIFQWLVSFFREGNGSPLQYSCLKNPMDGGAW